MVLEIVKGVFHLILHSQVVLNLEINGVIAIHWFQGLTVEDPISDGQRAFEVFVLFTVAIEDGFHRLLCQVYLEGVIPVVLLLGRKVFLLPLNSMGQGIRCDSLDVLNIYLGIPYQPSQCLGIGLDGGGQSIGCTIPYLMAQISRKMAPLLTILNGSLLPIFVTEGELGK
jgi:hypothetical protein